MHYARACELVKQERRNLTLIDKLMQLQAAHQRGRHRIEYKIWDLHLSRLQGVQVATNERMYEHRCLMLDLYPSRPQGIRVAVDKELHEHKCPDR